MNTSTIPVFVSGDEANVNKATGHFYPYADFKGIEFTYELADGVCTVYSITNPSSRRGLFVETPFSFRVNDLGSGELGEIRLDADTMQFSGVCPAWRTSMNRNVTPLQLAAELGY